MLRCGCNSFLAGACRVLLAPVGRSQSPGKRQRKVFTLGPAAVNSASEIWHTMLKLYSYFRSSAAYRVRIALNLKGLPYEIVAIHLLRDGGQHKRPDYRAINPQMRIPALMLATGEVLIQSLAIIEYLEEICPEPRLLPNEPVRRAQARAIAQIVACDMHPLNNSGTLEYLRTVGLDQGTMENWYAHWVITGFLAIEAMISPGPYALGEQLSLADLCLVPQLANARRLRVPTEQFPRILSIAAQCQKLEAFEKARPENQPDAE
jgi:maleylacetoacetate isomerase